MTTSVGARGRTGFRLGRLFKWLLGLVALLVLAAVAGFAWFVLWPVATLPPLEAVDEQRYLDQGWGTERNSASRQTYYYTPQGTSMPQGATTDAVRYAWFVHLRLPFSDQRFADPDHLRRYRFLVDPAPTPANPDQLPVGFTRHFDPISGDELLDITCAACHTGQLHYSRDGRRYALRVDGGQAMHALTDTARGAFAPMLVASLLYTAINPFKFDAFAREVLGERYPDGRAALKSDLWATIGRFVLDPQNNPLKHLEPVREGYGRTDALGRIGNTVFGDHLIPGNFQVSAAPVSYPYLWNIWKFDWVQYNGSVAQPLARNIGEALGVGARIPLVDDTGAPLPPAERFRSSVRIADSVRIEHSLQRLEPPAWPEDLFGQVDRKLAGQGLALFERHCRGCHGPHPVSAARQQAQAPLKPSPDLEWRIEVVPAEHIGTDPAAARAFLERHYDLSPTGLGAADLESVLRPPLELQLVRQVRYRLAEVVRLREAQELTPGELPALLADYPANPAPEGIPEARFAALREALQALPETLPAVPGVHSPPPYSADCGLDCQTLALLWQLERGEESIALALEALDVSRLTEGEALNVVGLLIKRRFYEDAGLSFEQQQCLEGFGTLDLPQQIDGYKPRPLAGVWATPPFLHNGSVPTLYQMLSPPETRDRRFLVGSRDYDPVKLGYRVIRAEDARGDERGFWLDTGLAGNGNGGHAFAADPELWARHQAAPADNPLPSGVIGPLLSHDERMALLEYLKIHADGPATPAGFAAPDCGLPGERL